MKSASAHSVVSRLDDFTGTPPAGCTASGKKGFLRRSSRIVWGHGPPPSARPFATTAPDRAGVAYLSGDGPAPVRSGVAFGPVAQLVRAHA